MEKLSGDSAAQRVYFIRASNGLIKIGVSKAPHARVAELQVGCPIPLRLVVSFSTEEIPESLARTLSEKGLQRAFAKARVRGEWFRPVPDLLELIAEVKRQARAARRRDERTAQRAALAA
jgi:hypothetical protein